MTLVDALNMARRHLQPHEWGAAFRQLLVLRGVERGPGKRRDLSTSANFAEVREELGVSERTAYDRLALADDYAELPAEDAQRLEVEVADIRTLRTERRFDAAYSLFHVMSYLPTDDDIRAAVEEACGGDLLDEDTDEVVDVVLLWWRDGDGDLVDVHQIAVPVSPPQQNDVDHLVGVFIEQVAAAGFLDRSADVVVGR